MARKRQESHAAPAAGGIGWRAALIALAVALVYANSLHGPFVLDDNAAIVQNEQIRDLSRPAAVFHPESESPVAGRPLVNLSFALNYAVGGLDVRGFHVFNIGLHVICSLLAFGLFRRTLELSRIRRHINGSDVNLAFVAALLWAVHPLNTEVVDYLTQRSESMMAALYLATLYATTRALTDARRRRWELLAVVSCALGMLCKESMATAPLMVALYDRIVAFDSWRDAIRKRLRLYLGLAATWLVAIGLAGARSGVAGFASGVSPWTYLQNQAVVISHYLRLSFWPRGLVVFYGWPVPLGFDVLPYAMLMIVATIIALVRAPAVGLAGVWFFVTLAPASSVIPVATEVGAERRMYLPLLAIALLTVAVSHAVWKRLAAMRTPATVPAIAVGAVALALAAATIARNREYASPLSLAQTVVNRRPTGIAYHIFGEQLMLEGRDADAIPPLTEAVARGDSRAGYPLGVALVNQRNLDEGVRQLDAFVRTSALPYRLVPRWLEPPRSEVVSARLLMARVFASEHRWTEAMKQAELILTLMPSHEEARRLLAQVLINIGFERVVAGDFDEAVKSFRRALTLDPANESASTLLSLALKDQQRAAAPR